MKKITLSLFALLSVAGASVMAVNTGADIGEGMVSTQTRASVGEIVRTAVRHFLNFRKETPLSDTQKTAISKVFEEHRAEIQAQFTQGRDARRAMAAAAKEDANGAPTKAAAEKIGNVARDRALLIARVGAQVKALLTESQHKRIDTARAEIETLIETKETERAGLATEMNDPNFYLQRKDAKEMIARYELLGREIDKLYEDLVGIEEAGARS